jgi:hypothetical protein
MRSALAAFAVVACAHVAMAEERVTPPEGGAKGATDDQRDSPRDSPKATPKIEDENGTPVTITSDHTDTTIFIAKGAVPSTVYPDPFEKLGQAPVTVKLSPGLYTIESDGPTQTMGHETITVDRWPVKVQVRTGDATVRALGTVSIAAGVLAILSGIVVITTFGHNESAQNTNKYTVAIPLLVGGGILGLGGVGFSFLGATHVRSSIGGSVSLRF